MRKFVVVCSIIFILLFVSIFLPIAIQAATSVDDAVYFGSKGCLACQSLERSKVLDEIESRGYQLKRYIAEDDFKTYEQMFVRYAKTYDVPKSENLIPILYVGNTYFVGEKAIEEGVTSGLIFTIMDTTPLYEPILLVYKDLTLNDLFVLITSTIILGILDALNPCALAMLLLFLSFIIDKKQTKSVVIICGLYILGIFLTYITLGNLFAYVFSTYQPPLMVFYVVLILITLFVSILNFIDYYLYQRKISQGSINRLPEEFFTLTRRIMNHFSKKVESGHYSVFLFAFIIGVFIAFIEFPCSGQAFVAWSGIMVDRTSDALIFQLLIFTYVVLFVSPLLLISYLGLKAKRVDGIRVFIRAHIPVIKLLNAIIFLGVAIYYLFRLFG